MVVEVGHTLVADTAVLGVFTSEREGIIQKNHDKITTIIDAIHDIILYTNGLLQCSMN